ncbi:MAG TPA: hypothetical protein VGV37_05010 [Aliidongia sp.]|uniref:hypothetical protein n=1 Tax=Aliidongia sp. TaxID=1914230 RepID=UPI002DDD66FC|nr:hypothetical protein [Aliidongia sp.]HEV2673879.1 hypothetical protein [Aliidongia sp.]
MGIGDGTSLPQMEYDYLDDSIREIADNIWHAQMAGWPRILTYVYRPKAEKRQLRRLTLELVPGIQSRDEYPFASTLENEGSVWVGHASVAQQNAQRDLMNRFFRQGGAYKAGSTFRFEVVVLNHPKGPVTA